MATLKGIWILSVSSTINQVTLILIVGNDKYIILCNFSGRIMNGFEVIEG